MKNKTEIMKSVNGVTSKAVMKLKKHSPEILVVAGIAGTVVSAVLACKATTKVAEILDETKGTLDTIHEGMETGAINGQEYTNEDGKKDTVVVYAQTGMKLAKLYGPAIILGTLSITSILASNNILRKRNVALGAADVQRPQKAYGMSEEIVISDTVIRCSNRNRCKNIERYLRKKVTNDGVGKTDEAMP